VEHGVAEHRVELRVEREIAGVDDARVEATLACRPDLFRAAVDGDHQAARVPKPLGQGTIATPEVQDALARFRV
jgi:hypothetical protein